MAAGFGGWPALIVATSNVGPVDAWAKASIGAIITNKISTTLRTLTM